MEAKEGEKGEEEEGVVHVREMTVDRTALKIARISGLWTGLAGDF